MRKDAIYAMVLATSGLELMWHKRECQCSECLAWEKANDIYNYWKVSPNSIIAWFRYRKLGKAISDLIRAVDN